MARPTKDRGAVGRTWRPGRGVQGTPPRSGAAGGREVECPGHGRDNRSIIEIVVKTQLQAGYTVSPSGACFTSPFFLLAACLDPEKVHLGKKSESNTGDTEKTSASSEVAIGCKASGYELASRSVVARWMDPTTDRFASVDPEDGCIQCPLSLHRYLYAEASPISKFDPSGRITLVELMGSITTHNVLQGLNRGIKVQQGRRIAVKAGCAVLEEAFETVLMEGVYLILINGTPYVGQSNNIPRRLKEHARKYGQEAIKVVEAFSMKGAGKGARELFEQLVLDEFKDKGFQLSGSIANEVNPVSSARKLTKQFADKIGGLFSFCK